MRLFILSFFFLGSVLNFNLIPQHVVINEILASNTSINADDDGDFEDWIELYNPTNETISLDGYGLSDDETHFFKWTLPDVSLAPDTYLLIYCSDKDRTNPDFPLHTNFKISAAGETITLVSPSETIIDQLPPVVLQPNISYGRSPNGSANFSVFQEPSPGMPNPFQNTIETLSPPVFSEASGFFTDEFTLSISHPDPDVTILYTLDGSVPHIDQLEGVTYNFKNTYPKNPGDSFGTLINKSFSTLTYNNPILIADCTSAPNDVSEISTTHDHTPDYIPQVPILKSNVIRAVAYKNGNYSDVVTNNYFFNDSPTLPVIALNFNHNLFFDYVDGIGVAGVDFDQWRTANPFSTSNFFDANYERSGDAWEIDAQMNYYVAGEEVLNQSIGLRIHGGNTRKNALKSLRIYARNSYGANTLNYPFFGQYNSDNFKRIILRNSGNDFKTTFFLDAFIHQSVKHLHFETQDYQPSTVFLNGEYWGILNIRERYDKHYFNRVFNINENELDYIEIGGGLIAKEGDLDHYNDMISYLESNTLADNENFEYITTLLDPENFADYHITGIYINNHDWMHNNVELFRKKTITFNPEAPYGHDGRWRWILKDTDVAYGLHGFSSDNTLGYLMDPNFPDNPYISWSTLVFRKMIENEGFKTYFINRFADLLNTTFLPSRQSSIFLNLKENITAEYPLHMERWNIFENIQTWHDYCAAINHFSFQRPAFQREHLQLQFDLDTTINTLLDVSDDTYGYIKINTIDILPATPGIETHPYPWSGVYFEGVPLKISAVPHQGYVFSHWTGTMTGTSPEIIITPESDITLTAHFVPSDETSPEEIIYFWIMDNDLPNDTPLTSIAATFEVSGQGILNFQSCLEDYPYHATHPLWRKASMERRNSPTTINYLPEANNEIPFVEANMRGLQIKQPFQNNGFENTIIFDVPTNDYENIVFAFAAKNENAVDNLLIDYAISEDVVVWTNEGLSNPTLVLSEDFQLFEVNLSDIDEIKDNPDFKIRIRFHGSDMTLDHGDRVTFNNFSLQGTKINLSADDFENLEFQLYPNPVNDILYVNHPYTNVSYNIYTFDGKLMQQGLLRHQNIRVSRLLSGFYFIVFEVENKKAIKKIIKK